VIRRVLCGSVATVAILMVGQCMAPPAASPSTRAITPVTVIVSTPPTDAPLLPAVRLNPPTTPAPSTTQMSSTSSPPSGVLPAPKYSTWPQWRTTSEGVPFYAGRPSCTPAQAEQIAAEFLPAGASVSTAQWAIYVASRESGCNHLAVRISGTDDSHCAFQLNARTGGPLSPAGILGQLGWTPTSVKASLTACARAATDLWQQCGKGPWIAGDYSCRKPTS
jgi:hypothetical protein